MNRATSKQISDSHKVSYSGEIYSMSETKEHLRKINQSEYLGSGKHRRFNKKYTKLYHSILHHTQYLDKTINICLGGRTDALINNTPHLCKCKQQSKYNANAQTFQKYCTKCKPKLTIEFFKDKYPETYEYEYKQYKKTYKEKTRNIGSLKWYKNKYPNNHTLAEKLYNNRYRNKKTVSYTKTSQTLFRDIMGIMNLSDVHFAEHNGEEKFVLTGTERNLFEETKHHIMVDFKYKNKIIEFNGAYWHKSQKIRNSDIIRKRILESRGYEVLFIHESEYKNNKEVVTERCIRFLNNEFRMQSRYMIETKPGEYHSFDGVVNRGKHHTLKIKTQSTSIEVSENHEFVIKSESIKASELKIGDYLEVNEKLEYIESINTGGKKKDVYDVLHTSTEDNNYLANKINNHNCSFIGSSHTLIPADTLAKMVPGEVEEVWDDKLNIYHKPQKGHQYIMSVDPAKDGKDGFSVDVIDITGFRFKQVASCSLQIEYLRMPEFLSEWCERYFNPYLIIENNEGAGQSVADQMYQTYEYENLHYDTKTDSNTKNKVKSRKSHPGTRTTSKSRRQILQTMKTLIMNDNLEVNSEDTINEFYTFILDKNKYQAQEGAHDDAVMSLALAFTIFNNTKNFEDMKKTTEIIFGDYEESKEVPVYDLLTIGGFDDATEENDAFIQKAPDEIISYEEYYVDQHENPTMSQVYRREVV